MTNLNTRMYNSNNKMYVDEDLTWKAFVKEKSINLEWFETQSILNTVEILLNT